MPRKFNIGEKVRFNVSDNPLKTARDYYHFFWRYEQPETEAVIFDYVPNHWRPYGVKVRFEDWNYIEKKNTLRTRRVWAPACVLEVAGNGLEKAIYFSKRGKNGKSE